MLILQASVGKGGQNLKPDVLLVQEVLSAIQVRTKFGMKSLWSKPKDGRGSPDLIQTIELVQSACKIQVNGRIDPRSQTLRKLELELPHTKRLAFQKTVATDEGRMMLNRRGPWLTNYWLTP